MVYVDAVGGTQTLTDNDGITIIEPTLSITKDVTAVAPVDAGDTVNYQVTVNNPARANTNTAYDVVISDLLPPTLALNLPPTVTLNGGSIGITDNSSGNSIEIVIAEVPVGGSVTVNYSAVVQIGVQPGQTINNSPQVQWSSLPGTPPQERDGSGAPLDDYITSDPASFMTGGPVFTKILEETSEPGSTGSNVLIGERVTYALTVTLPEGTTPSLVVADDLPSGLVYVPGSGALDVTGFAGSVNVVDPTVTCSGTCGSGDNLTFTFSNPIVVTADNNPANNSFILRLQAIVTNEAGDQDGQVLNNLATLTIPGIPPITPPVVPVTVIEPVLDLTKTTSDTTPGINQVISFTLALEHLPTSTADAQDVEILTHFQLGYPLTWSVFRPLRLQSAAQQV